jgi:uncharacterized protein Yka (UPF0111/DUF47 family)
MIEKLAEAVCSCPQHLKTYMVTKDANGRARAGQSIVDARLRSKEIAAQISAELCRSYVTPFDRDDIQDFTSALYKIPKIIEKVKERIDLHGLDGGDFGRQIDVITEEASAMDDLVKDLVRKPDSRRIQDKVRILYELEGKGDAILGELLKTLFQEHTEARDLILRKDIYDMLEKVIDRYRDAAGVALQIVLKHG